MGSLQGTEHGRLKDLVGPTPCRSEPPGVRGTCHQQGKRENRRLLSILHKASKVAAFLVCIFSRHTISVSKLEGFGNDRQSRHATPAQLWAWLRSEPRRHIQGSPRRRKLLRFRRSLCKGLDHTHRETWLLNSCNVATET
jgi:hypothetical protein